MKTEPLPNLPAARDAAEAAFGIEFRHYIEKYHPLHDSTFELKHTHGATSIVFSAVESSQIAWAVKIEQKGALARVSGTTGEPDYWWLKGAYAFIVVRYPSFWCMIRASEWVRERDRSKRKSLTEERARVIASLVI